MRLRVILLTLSICLNFCLFAQDKKEYQDPALWIELEKESNDVPVEIKSITGNISYHNAPIKFISRKDDRLKLMEIAVDSIKYEAIGENRSIVYLNGKLDLSCCRNKPVNMEFYNDEDNLIQFSRTDKDGNFKIKSVNGNMLEIKNYKLKLNFKLLKTIDENWDERFASLERNSIPDDGKLERMQKREKRKVEDQ